MAGINSLHLVIATVTRQTTNIITVVTITKEKLTEATKLMSVYVPSVVISVIKLLKQKPVQNAANM